MAEEKTAIVTGSSSGIGFEASLLLAKNGFRTYATVRDLDKAKAIKEISDKGEIPIQVVELDVDSDKSVEDAIDRINDESKRIDVLVNNAGYALVGALEDLSMDEIKAQFETNPSMTEEHEHTSNETATERTTTEGTTTVRDSVFALLADHTIPASGFIHLYDTTPYSIKNGHVAAKIPCDDESAPLLNVLIGVAPQFTPAPLELVANLSTPGELCLYHVDLPAPEPEQQANTTTTTAANTTTAAMITDIAIQNPGDEDITLPSTSTVVIGINEIEKGANTHEEGEGG